MLKDYPAIAAISRFILPYIIIFACYIQFNGEDSPGGGFQAGVIFATALVAYSLAFGSQQLQQLFSLDTLLSIAAIGVLIYAGTGIVTMLYGGTFLDYSALPLMQGQAQRFGIMLVELGVGLTVSSSMMMIYLLFTE